MKKLLKSLSLLSLLAVIVSSCGTKQSGQLLGVMDRPAWKGINPYGMVYVPSGTLHIGPSDQDITNTFVQRPKTISIQGFYMDDTEITNNEYRQFVYWVRDSIAHKLLDHVYTPEDESAEDDLIDWEMEIDWSDETLDELFYQGDDKFAGKKELDISKLEYEYEWYDWQRAAHSKTGRRTDFINRDKVLVYPDTLVWIRDFAYSYNEPMTRNYFWHPAFDDYPVVGIDWKMANAFCYWRTKLWNSFQVGVNTEDFRPTY